jgi:hypothetical protein
MTLMVTVHALSTHKLSLFDLRLPFLLSSSRRVRGRGLLVLIYTAIPASTPKSAGVVCCAQ